MPSIRVDGFKPDDVKNALQDIARPGDVAKLAYALQIKNGIEFTPEKYANDLDASFSRQTRQAFAALANSKVADHIDQDPTVAPLWGTLPSVQSVMAHIQAERTD